MRTDAEKILDLITRHPGTLTVAIADFTDIDVDVVERELAVLAAHDHIVGECITAPNGCLTMSWRVMPRFDVPDAAAPVLAKPSPGDDPLLTPKSEGISATSSAVKKEKVMEPSTISTGVTRPPGKLAIQAIDYVRQHGSATNDDLKRVLAIGYLPMAALRQAVRAGWLAYENHTWRLGDVMAPPAATEKRTAVEPRAVVTSQGVNIDAAHATVATLPAVEPMPATPRDNIHAPSHYTAGGLEVIDILRAKLSPEEFRGYCKGNVIKYTLRAELKDGAKDYAKGRVYADWLAEIAQPTV